jgi:hypothetical protein
MARLSPGQPAQAHNIGPGPGVDYYGTPVPDPSLNVNAVIYDAMRRQDDLRKSHNKSIRREMKLTNKYERKLALAESARIDDIHKADEAAKAREAIVNAATQATLAKQVTDTATALSNQVETQRQSTASELRTALTPINEKLGVLERALYAGQGGVLAAAEARTEQNQASGGRRENWQLAIAAMGLVLLVMAAIIGFLAASHGATTTVP